MKRLLLALGATLALTSAATATDFTLCSGGKDGLYYSEGDQLRANLVGKVNVINATSEGSESSLRRLEGVPVTDKDGKPQPRCNGAIVQADSLPWYKANYRNNALQTQRVAELHTERTYLICNKDAGIDQLTDLRGAKGKTLVVGKPGSGSAITWSNFVKAEKDYEGINTLPLDGTIAENKLRNNDVSCLLWVAGAGSPKMANIEDRSNGALKLITLNKSKVTDFKDEKGKPVYFWDTIGSSAYPKLYNGWGSLDTVGQRAIFLVDEQWASDNEQAYTDVSNAVVRLAKTWATK